MNLEQSYCCLGTILPLPYLAPPQYLLWVHGETSHHLRIILLLSQNFLITVLFCSTPLLLCDRGESSYHLRTILLLSQNYLITVLL